MKLSAKPRLDHATKPARMTTLRLYICTGGETSQITLRLRCICLDFLLVRRPKVSVAKRGCPMPPTIRPARPDEYDAIALVWMNSWASTGLEQPSTSLLEKLRARISSEIANGWSLFVADDNGTIAAMLALHVPAFHLDMLFVAPEYQGQNLGRRLLTFTREQLPEEIWLRCVRENEKAWRWYEREGFVLEKEVIEPMTGFVMKYYRWKKPENSR